MNKLRTVFLIVVSICFVIACNQQHDQHDKNANLKTGNYKFGDCFEFKEKIKDFGVIFLEENDYADGKEFNLFPVKLDTTKTGIDKFKYGKVYLTEFPDFTKSNGKTEGFTVYHFLHQKDFQTINSYFSYTGTINIKETYKNVTGGTIATSIDGFRFQLNHWDSIFGYNGNLLLVSAITN